MSTSTDMGTLITYFLQTSVGIVLFYLLYLLLLKNETFYRANRFFLISGLLLALSLPLFPVSYESPISIMNNSEFFSFSEKPISEETGNTVAAQQENGFLINISQFLKLVYLVGVMFFLSRLIWQTVRIFRKIRKSKYTMIDDIKVINQKTTMPFSFFNVVFIDILAYSERELSNIIAHEKVHIQERHWIDLLIIELLTVLFWGNPVVWLYERSIKQNHEYLADRGVLLAGYNPGSYQALLINQLMGVKVLGFAHNLNFSLNKKRMEMMKKEKSPGVSKMKLLLVLPAIALLVFAFAKKEYVMMNAENMPSNTPIIFEQSETQKDLIKVKGKVVNSEGEPLTGANVFLINTNIGTVVDERGEFELFASKTDKPLTGRLEKDRMKNGIETIENANIIVVSYVGYITIQIAFDSRKDKEFGNIRLTKSVYDIVFPEIRDSETLVNGEVREVPPPPPPRKGRNDEAFEVVEEMPYYSKSGIYGLAMDIKKEAVTIMKETNDRGIAVVGFTLTADGDITNCQIVESSNSKLLDGSAIKIVQKLDSWDPGVQRGKRVPVNLTVPVSFN